MKLEKLFEGKDNRLYSIGGSDGKEIPVTKEMAVSVKWSEVEPGEAEQYNEEYLADLRLSLKSKEEKKEFVFIEPVFDKKDGAAQFTAAMTHAARRVKDCVSVIGFAIPDALSKSETDDFMSSLLEKHGQYVFFYRDSGSSSAEKVSKLVVLYKM